MTFLPKPKPKYRLTGPFLGTETEYTKIWNRNQNRTMKNFGTKTELSAMKNLETETDEAQKSETGRFLSLIILLLNYIII